MRFADAVPRWVRAPLICALLVNGALLCGLERLTAPRALPETRIIVELPPPVTPQRTLTPRPVTRIPQPMTRISEKHQAVLLPLKALPRRMAEPPRPLEFSRSALPPRWRATPAMPALPHPSSTGPALSLPMLALPPAASLPPDMPREPGPADPTPAPSALAQPMPGEGGAPGSPAAPHLLPAPGNTRADLHGGRQGDGHDTGTGAAPGPGPRAGVTPAATPATHHGAATPAAMLQQATPLYPPAARRDGVEGTVVLRVTLSPRGTAEQVEVITSSGDFRLDNAAIQAVKVSSYTPRREDGQAVASTIRVRITFRLQDDG